MRTENSIVYSSRQGPLNWNCLDQLGNLERCSLSLCSFLLEKNRLLLFFSQWHDSERDRSCRKRYCECNDGLAEGGFD